jgi:signal transduction histidine kinase
MKSQFIQNVSHELRTPLAIVKGYLDLVLDASFGFKLEPNMEQALKAMQTHTNRLTSLVESITTLENVETGQLERNPQPILPVFMRALQAVRQKAERNHVEMLVELDQQLPQVNLDPQQLGLALWHLLDNAIKFNRPGGRIWVNAQQQGDEIICSIRDEGIGIPLSEQVRIFERFYQVDGSTKRRYEGMGLGLSIAREVVEKHGGRIWVYSEGVDTGAIFKITLPVYHEDLRA